MEKEEMKKSIDDFIKEWEDYKNEPQDCKLKFFKSYWFITDYSKPTPNIESLGSTGKTDPKIDYFNKKLQEGYKIAFKNELHSSGLRKRWANTRKIFVSLFRSSNS